MGGGTGGDDSEPSDESVPESTDESVPDPAGGSERRSTRDPNRGPSDGPTLSAPSRTLRFLSGAAVAGLIGDLIQDVISAIVVELIVGTFLALGAGHRVLESRPADLSPSPDQPARGTPIEPTDPVSPTHPPFDVGRTPIGPTEPHAPAPPPVDPTPTPPPTETPIPADADPITFVPTDEVRVLGTLLAVVFVLLILWTLVRPLALSSLHTRTDVSVPDAAFAGLSAGILFGALGGWITAAVAAVIAAGLAVWFHNGSSVLPRY